MKSFEPRQNAPQIQLASRWNQFRCSTLYFSQKQKRAVRPFVWLTDFSDKISFAARSDYDRHYPILSYPADD